MSSIDYSLYLVTGRAQLSATRGYLDTLEEALKGGVTLVQVREKECDGGQFLQIARETKEVCDRYRVPLLINDRLDIAILVNADGVHLGQDDISLLEARKILGKDKIIGISVNTAAQAELAIEGGADYLGIGAAYATTSKIVKSELLGPRGVREMLRIVKGRVPCVTIGGITADNLEGLLRRSSCHDPKDSMIRSLDGVAVISSIMAQQEPKMAAQALRGIVAKHKSSLTQGGVKPSLERDVVVSACAKALEKLRSRRSGSHPSIIHHITNDVVKNDTANVTLALDASPIMSQNAAEAEDLAPIVGALLLNMGTVTALVKEAMMTAGRAANRQSLREGPAFTPVVVDPVGVGATSIRKEAAQELLNNVEVNIIKGNAAEIGHLADPLGDEGEVTSRGVDSSGSSKDPAAVVRKLAMREDLVVVMTGPVDYIASPAGKVYMVRNGHPLLGKITGSGCMATTCIAVFAAAMAEDVEVEPSLSVQSDRMLVAAIAGILSIGVAAEYAARAPGTRGPNSFRMALIDALANLSSGEIVEAARLEMI